MSFILSIDQGTTSSRAIVYDHDGGIVAHSQLKHKQYHLHSGWVEHDPYELYENVKSCIGNAIEQLPEDYSIFTVGVTNQRETTLLWNKETGKPYYNAIVWQDTRTEDICKKLSKEIDENFLHNHTGLYLTPYFSATKIVWLMENLPDIKADIEKNLVCFGTIDSWLIWKMTGEHVTDITNASRTMLMNIHSFDWDEDILDFFGIPTSILPKIVPSVSSKPYGYINDIPALDRVPINGCLGDQQAAMMGQLCFEKGDLKSTYGTGCFMLVNTGTEPVLSQNGLLTTVCYQVDSSQPVYALEGSVAAAGYAVDWLAENLGIFEKAEDVADLARTVSDNGGVYYVPAFSGLQAPYWKVDARGVIVGLTGYTTKAHIARAAEEAICYQAKELIDALIHDSNSIMFQLKVDGGASKDDLLMQLQADILGVEVIRPENIESTSLGVAIAAGIAVGYWEDIDEVKKIWKVGKSWSPSNYDGLRNEGYVRWKDAVSRTIGLAKGEVELPTYNDDQDRF